MAPYSGFIRKAPTGRLRRFFEVKGVAAPDDFDWTSQGRGTALVKSIDDLLAELPDRKQDNVKAELDLLASLSDKNGLIGAEQICAWLQPPRLRGRGCLRIDRPPMGPAHNGIKGRRSASFTSS